MNVMKIFTLARERSLKYFTVFGLFETLENCFITQINTGVHVKYADVLI